VQRWRVEQTPRTQPPSRNMPRSAKTIFSCQSPLLAFCPGRQRALLRCLGWASPDTASR
jgi:hypothetical protein